MPSWPSCTSWSINFESNFVDGLKLIFESEFFRHVRGRVLAALANGQVAIFARSATDGEWDLSAYWLLELAPPTVAVRCLTRVHSTVWAAFRNKIAVIDPESLRVEVPFALQFLRPFKKLAIQLFWNRLASKLIRAKKAKSGNCVGLVTESGYRSGWILLSGSSTPTTSGTCRTSMSNPTSLKCSVYFI